MPGKHKKIYFDHGSFVESCYLNILGRKSDPKGKSHYLFLLSSGFDPFEIIKSFIESEEFKTKIMKPEFVLPEHFYSCIPSLEDIEKDKSFLPDLNCWQKPTPNSIDLQLSSQKKLLKRLKLYYKDIPFHPGKKEGLLYYFDNGSYSYSDGIFLYSIMRHYRPKKIIEVGCGFSSCLMIDVNNLFFESKISLSFIDPYPDLLLNLTNNDDDGKFRLIKSKLQDVPLSEFKSLSKNDILFLDSSHVSKFGSDVNHYIFEILPILNKGVIIHIHDIFYPFEIYRPWLLEKRYWNEQYLLRAFLMYNNSFRVLLFSTYMFKEVRKKWFRENMPDCLKCIGGSIWLKKCK